MSRGNRRRKPASTLNLGALFTVPRRGSGIAARFAARRSRLGKSELPPRSQASVGYLFLFVLLSFSVTAALIYHLHLRFEGVWLGYETSRVRAERAQLVAEQRELRLELSSLKSPERVESEAREKLGMEMPSLDQIVPMEKRAMPVLASGRAR